MSVPARPWHGWWLPALFSVLLYTRALYGGFTFDDKAAVQGNRDVTDANSPWSRILQSDFWGTLAHMQTSNKSYRCAGGGHRVNVRAKRACRPLTIAMFRSVRVLAGTTPLTAAPFHVVNVALHAGVCGLRGLSGLLSPPAAQR